MIHADDTTLLKSHENLEILTNIVNTEFKKIFHFFRAHKLALHPDKTKFMLFSSQKVNAKPSIFINLNDPNTVDQTNPIVPMQCLNTSSQPYYKFLGVYIDPQLNF